MLKAKARDLLAANLHTLRAAGIGPRGQRAFAEKARVGEGTVSRARRGDGSTTLDSVDALAAFLKFEAWQLLVPNLDPIAPPRLAIARRSNASEDRPAEEGVDVEFLAEERELIRAFRELPGDQRREIRRHILTAALAYQGGERVDDVKVHGRPPSGTPPGTASANANDSPTSSPPRKPSGRR